MTEPKNDEVTEVLTRLMICVAKHQGNPQEWIDGRCITPSQAKAAINQLIARKEKEARIDELDRSPSTYPNAAAVKRYYQKRRAKLEAKLESLKSKQGE